MSFFQCCFHSDCLGMAVNVNVVLPQGAVKSQIGMDSAGGEKLPPVLYLLHGLSDDQTIWMRRTSIERYATEHGIAVVMPCGNRSFYCNTVDGMRFYDYIADELPTMIGHAFRVSQRREDTAIGGLSMGGYGALRIGLLNPQKYCAIAALSAVICADWCRAGRPELYRADFGDIEPTGTQYDLFHLASQLAADASSPNPMIYQACGEQDGLLADNQRFCAHLSANGMTPKWVALPGTHCWEFWDARIREVLDWLPFNKQD
jgi:putative tributyrin esterase